MHKLSLISILLILSGCVSTLPPAGPAGSPIKQADTIILTVDKRPQEAYKAFAQHLMDKGFSLTNTDQSLQIIETEFMQIPNTGYSQEVKFSSSIREDSLTKIYLSGKERTPELGRMEIDNTGQSNSVAQRSWNFMHDVARQYPHQQILYKRN